MAKKLPVADQRMLVLMAHAVQTSRARNQKDFLESVGFLPNNIAKVRNGDRGFTVEQITAACRRYRVNANWILGLSDEMVSRPAKSPIQNLKDAVKAVEAELAKK